MRWIISQIANLWRVSIVDRNEPESSMTSVANGVTRNWRPWDHIFALCRVGKSPPQYNPHGKYIVRLYWMVGSQVLVSHYAGNHFYTNYLIMVE